MYLNSSQVNRQPSIDLKEVKTKKEHCYLCHLGKNCLLSQDVSSNTKDGVFGKQILAQNSD